MWRSWGASSPSRSAAASGIGVPVCQPVGAQERTSITGRLSSPATSSATSKTWAALEAAGWKVLVLWEHQLKKKELPATRRLLYEFVRREDDPDYDEAFPVCEGE